MGYLRVQGPHTNVLQSFSAINTSCIFLFDENPYFDKFLHSFIRELIWGQSTLLGNLWIYPGRLVLVRSVLSSVF